MRGKISEFYAFTASEGFILAEVHFERPNQPIQAFQPIWPVPLTLKPAFDYSDPTIFTQEVSHE